MPNTKEICQTISNYVFVMSLRGDVSAAWIQPVKLGLSAELASDAAATSA